MEPNHTTARKLGPLLIVQYSLVSIEVGGAVIEIAGQCLQRDSSIRAKSFAMSRFDLCNVGTSYSIKKYSVHFYCGGRNNICFVYVTALRQLFILR